MVTERLLSSDQYSIVMSPHEKIYYAFIYKDKYLVGSCNNIQCNKTDDYGNDRLLRTVLAAVAVRRRSS